MMVSPVFVAEILTALMADVSLTVQIGEIV
jgi:hypothetical protein